VDEVEHCSVEFDCVDFDHCVTVENLSWPVLPSEGETYRASCILEGYWSDQVSAGHLRDGYSLPFMSLPQKSFFACLLLASGAATERKWFVTHWVLRTLLASRD